MTQEEKELLIRDFCARLPYGVKCCDFCYNDEGGIINTVEILECIYPSTMEYKYKYVDAKHDIERIKPYLRPMSSMTDEEREEWADLFNLELDKLNEIDDENKAEELAPYYFGKSHQVSIDWLNKKMFDHRSLIEKGLALEAPEDMYETK